MTTATTQVSEGALTQQGQIGHVSTALQQMSDTISQAAEQASRAAQAAQEANDCAREGSANLSDTQLEIGRLAEQLKDTNQEMRSLAEQSHHIGKVLSVIKTIADQTNLLALNAAIEAARAEEQGRGFAVVADEVRALAQKTAASTTEIEGIIHSLQAAVVERLNS
jgi:methyl-accepting chemotaxis protein